MAQIYNLIKNNLDVRSHAVNSQIGITRVDRFWCQITISEGGECLLKYCFIIFA